MQYDHESVEKKWQQRWKDADLFRASDDSSKPKKYILDMYPYPSGAGLHVGHVEGYTATDIYSRYLRMKGFEVLHPMGWDAFGLPAENYAVKTGIPPAQTTEEAIKTFTAQINSLGLSYDWSREVGTHRPDYYKWTQWLFQLLYKNDLAYKQKAKVNWCPKDQTVLANEQVVNGACERCGTEVIQKDLEQWFFRITKYAEALLSDLDGIDWPESTKAAQRNWIGKSEGAEIDFSVAGGSAHIKVFTTRPDTLFGATYMVLAPEHPLIDELQSQITNFDDVTAYREVTAKKTELERTALAKEKTGVELKGARAINPATKESIPVFIADYVLSHYGTGAIMAVPAHDERDFLFAQQYDLPIKQVILPSLVDERNPPREGKDNTFRNIILAIVHDTKTNRFLALQWKKTGWTTFVTGGVEEGEDRVEAARREIAEETGYTNLAFARSLGVSESHFFAEHKDVNRRVHAESLLFELVDDSRVSVAEEELAQHEALWLSPKEIEDAHLQHAEFSILWEKIKTGMDAYGGEGVLTHSEGFDGLENSQAKQKITEFVGGEMKTTYRLRDWLISRQRYWGAPIPMVYDPEGNLHLVPEEHLPWLLPTDVEFMPTGESPIAKSKELKERVEKIFGPGWRPEVDTMDTFMCSSWYFFRFTDPHNDKAFASKEKMDHWLPVDTYVGGAEHTVLHLLYARFFTKVLHELGYVDCMEPFAALRHPGTILAEDGRKMSKSLGNVVNPNDVVEQYGADSVRLYEMFMGPFSISKPWNTNNILGVRRFLERVWKLSESLTDAAVDPHDALLNQTIVKVSADIAAFKFNTAVSQLMILLNAFEKEGSVGKAQYAVLLQLLSPFAPHITEELWELLGNTTSIHTSVWPKADASKLVASEVAIGVQVNGKVRGTVHLSPEASEAEALEAGRTAEGVAKWLEAGREVKAVYVPGRIVSFVVEPKTP